MCDIGPIDDNPIASKYMNCDSFAEAWAYCRTLMIFMRDEDRTVNERRAIMAIQQPEPLIEITYHANQRRVESLPAKSESSKTRTATIKNKKTESHQQFKLRAPSLPVPLNAKRMEIDITKQKICKVVLDHNIVRKWVCVYLWQ